MKTDIEKSIIEHIRSLKEENAAEYGYSLEAIIASACKRQEASGRRIIRLNKGELVAGHEPATRRDSDAK